MTCKYEQVEGQLFELEQLQQQLPFLEQATTTLEELVGSASPSVDFPKGTPDQPQAVGADSLPSRLEAAAETASLVVAELQSIHRQLVTTGLLLQEEEARSKQLEADLTQAKVMTHSFSSWFWCVSETLKHAMSSLLS